MSDLKRRLNTLRHQSGRTPAAQAPPEDAVPSIAERVGQLRGRTGPARADVAELAGLLGGEMVAEGVVMVERRVPLDSEHGRFPLHRLRVPCSLPGADPLDPQGLLFLDTETTGLSGGSGTVVFMLGLARLEGEALVVRQYLLTAFAGEAAMLGAAVPWLEAAKGLVTFNGKSFDAPLLATRSRLAGLPDRLAGLSHIDLLHPTRRAFARRWPDCRLATVERRVLGFHRQDDLPGAEAPQAWFLFVRWGRADLLPAVARHNHWDLVTLAALLPLLAEVHERPERWGADPLGVARAYLGAGADATALDLLRRHRDGLDRDGLLEMGRLLRREEAWGEALPIWEQLAGQGCGESLERLAKYYEHVADDPHTALAYARRLAPGAERERRLARLGRRAVI